MVHAWAPSSRDLAALRHGHGRLRFGWRRKSSEASDVSHGGMIRRARWAIATVFFVNGLVIASWVPHIPAIKGRHALGDGELGPRPAGDGRRLGAVTAGRGLARGTPWKPRDDDDRGRRALPRPSPACLERKRVPALAFPGPAGRLERSARRFDECPCAL